MKFFPVVLVLSLLTGCAQPKKNSDTQSNDRSRTLEYSRIISFLSVDGDTLSTIEAAVADDTDERNHGLMDVRDLPKAKGMLFIFEKNEPRSFWMANTPLPLDIIFVNEDKEIVRIHHSTQPFSEKSLISEKPAKYVIETNAGYCVSHDIQEGLKVNF